MLGPISLLPVLLVARLAMAGDDLEIPPGMRGPRPTPECGGQPMMALWEAERVSRLQEIAGRALAGWAHGLGPRLGAATAEAELRRMEEAREVYEACAAALRPRDLACLAAASGRVELCDAEGDAGTREGCRAVAFAALARDRGDAAVCDLLDDPGLRDRCATAATGRLRCSGGAGSCAAQLLLSPSLCGSPGLLRALLPPLSEACGLIRALHAGGSDGRCGEGPGGRSEAFFAAVASRDPGSCPDAAAGDPGGRILDSACRDLVVGGLRPVASAPIPGGVVVSLTLVNPFPEPARCSLRLVASGPGAPRVDLPAPTVDLSPRERAWRASVTPVTLAVPDGYPGWTWSAGASCAFALRVADGMSGPWETAVPGFDVEESPAPFLRDPVEDFPGMRPRPTLACGGRKRMAAWDAEQELRRTERAVDGLSSWAHGAGARLGAIADTVQGDLSAEARARWEACTRSLPRRSPSCVAAALRRPELCVYEEDPGEGEGCPGLADGLRDLEDGEGAVPGLDGLTPARCLEAGALAIRLAGAAARCRHLLTLEAVRTDAPELCDALTEPGAAAACLAAFTGSPDGCPGPPGRSRGVLLDLPCRAAAVEEGVQSSMRREGDHVRAAVSVPNPFLAPGACALSFQIGAGAAARSLSAGWFHLAAAEHHETVTVTVAEALLGPLAESTAAEPLVFCWWALEDPDQRTTAWAEDVRGYVPQ